MQGGDTAMKRIVRIFAIVLLISIIAIFFILVREDKLNITIHSGAGNGDTLVVLVPTVGGNGKLYEQQGLIDVCRKYGARADIMAIDIQPTLYLNKRVVKKLKRHVIDPAKSRGYEHIFLAGTSLGGHAVLLYAMEYPEDIEGVFLVAPFVSDPFVVKIIRQAGGLQKWNACPSYAWGYSCDLWKSIRVYLADPARRASTFLGYGTQDRFVKSCQLLADVLPPENVFTAPGGHSWATWHMLWDAMLVHLETVRPSRFKR